MIKSSCVCREEARFTPFITYKNEAVFADYEGVCIRKCVHCGLLKTFSPGKAEKFDPLITKSEEYEARRKEFEVLFKPLVNFVKKYVPKGGSVLDVGCSSAILLQLLKAQKYIVTGIEPNNYAFQAAYKKLGSSIIQGTASSIDPHNQFDCIIYNHVLEHVEDINSEFIIIDKLLKKKGILIVGIPNTENVIFNIRKKYWEYLLPNEHRWHFSASYMRAFLRGKGYEFLDNYFCGDTRKDYPFIKRLYFGFLSFLNAILHTGESVFIVLRKS